MALLLKGIKRSKTGKKSKNNKKTFAVFALLALFVSIPALIVWMASGEDAQLTVGPRDFFDGVQERRRAQVGNP